MVNMGLESPQKNQGVAPFSRGHGDSSFTTTMFEASLCLFCMPNVSLKRPGTLARFYTDPFSGIAGSQGKRPLRSKRKILWMDEILHHFETVGNHCFLVFTGNSFQGFSGAANGYKGETDSWDPLGLRCTELSESTTLGAGRCAALGAAERREKGARKRGGGGGVSWSVERPGFIFFQHPGPKNCFCPSPKRKVL